MIGTYYQNTNHPTKAPKTEEPPKPKKPKNPNEPKKNQGTQHQKTPTKVEAHRLLKTCDFFEEAQQLKGSAEWHLEAERQRLRDQLDQQAQTVKTSFFVSFRVQFGGVLQRAILRKWKCKVFGFVWTEKKQKTESTKKPTQDKL